MRSRLDCCWISVGVVAFMVISLSPCWGADEAWLSNRAWLRKQRAAIRASVTRDRASRAKGYERSIAELLDVAREGRVSGQRMEIQRFLSGLQPLDREATSRLTKRLQTLPALPEVEDADFVWYWKRKLAAARKSAIDRPMQLLNRCVELRAFGLAYDLAEEVLEIDPNNQSLRARLGQTFYQGLWRTRHEVRQVRRGWIWDRALGWVLATDRARYDAGEYFDRQASAWTTLEAANQAHATVGNAWLIDTDHFHIRGTRPLRELVDTANKLEVFYRRIIAVYGRFFEQSGGAGHFVFGTREHPRLTVNIFRSRAQYATAVPKAATWSVGVFHTGVQASFFFRGDDRVRYHEITHQILHQLTGKNESPPWLTEGAAVYCESAYVQEDRLVIGDIAKSLQTIKYVARFQENQQMRLDDLFTLDSWNTWIASKDPKPQYEAAGALVQFLMTGRDGEMRADFIDYLRDSYREAAAGHPVWEYLGWDAHYSTCDSRHGSTAWPISMPRRSEPWDRWRSYSLTNGISSIEKTSQ